MAIKQVRREVFEQAILMLWNEPCRWKMSDPVVQKAAAMCNMHPHLFMKRVMEYTGDSPNALPEDFFI